MEFPVWRLGAFGGGFWIMVIAVLHVYVAHFAVGGGLFLVLAEWRARRAGSRVLLDYAHRLTKVFLLVTMVFGALSGVGIWLVISVLSPQATLLLVRGLVWGWATEWTFFAGEVALLLVYYYGYDRLEPRRHLAVGWLYFLFAFLSLFVINGLLTFMLTPGDWPRTLNFWDGLFNPTFWPSVVLRFALGTLLAGLFGMLTALRLPADEREGAVRFACRFVLAALPVLAMKLALRSVSLLRRKESGPGKLPDQTFRDQFAVVTVLFCASSLGVMGPMQEGLSGDAALLLVKALLDFFTAMIFAANIGGIVGVLALPQLLVQSTIFLLATAVVPFISPAMLGDFSACGGIIMLGTAVRQFRLVEVPILSMLPALVFVMPLSALWTRFFAS